MRVDDYEKFREGITGVMSFYGAGVTSFQLDVWWHAMRLHDLPAITDAFNRWVCNPDAGQYPPKPADIVRMLQGSTVDAALRAWAVVDRTLRTVGTWASVVFDDPITQRVIHDMGGWIGLGQKSEEEWPFVAKQFETRYRGYAGRGSLPDDWPGVLIGIAQAHNAPRGLPIDPPRLIGNAEHARLVLAGPAGYQSGVMALLEQRDRKAIA